MRIAATIAIAALAPLVLACCSDNTLRPINNSSSSSPPQTLVVTNASPNALTIGSGPAATSIPPGGTLKIAFHVDTVMMTSPSSSSPPGYTETFVESSTPARFDQEKKPPELIFHNGSVPVIATLSVDLCKPPGWRVNVTNSGHIRSGCPIRCRAFPSRCARHSSSATGLIQIKRFLRRRP